MQHALNLTENQLKSLLSISKLIPGEFSPLVGLVNTDEKMEPSNDDLQILTDYGLLTKNEPPSLPPEVYSGLRTLCDPSITISLLLGTPETLVTTYSYSARGFEDNAFVSFVQDPETRLFQLFIGQSPADIADLLTEQVIIGPVRDNVQFQAILIPEEYVILTCIQDHYQQLLVETTLDREMNREIWFNQRDLWEILVEGRISFDLNWQVTSSTYLLPFLDFELDEELISKSLDQLTERDLLIKSESGYYSLSDDLVQLLDYFLPVISFAAINFEVIKGPDELSLTHMVFLRGNSVNMIVQPVVDEEKRNEISIFTASGVQLAALLFEMGLQDQEIVDIADDNGKKEIFSICPSCNQAVEQDTTFCTNCGTALKSQETQPDSAVKTEIQTQEHKCPNCGAGYKTGIIYCTNCGSKLP